jgi:PAS domain S-box-containing protein
VGLIGVLSLTLGVWYMVRRMDQARMAALEASQASAILRQVERQMRNLEQILRGVAGYLGRGPLPTREEWRSYVRGLDYAATYPGLQSLNVVEWIPREALAAHILRLRAEGFPDYAVVPGGPLPPLPEGRSSIIYLEPMDARNQRAFGKDMLAEDVLRAAMLRARDTGQVILSGRVTLYQETQAEGQAGTLLIAPVYRPGQPTGTVTERRRALRGWTCIALRMTDFMRATLPRDLDLADLKLYDGDAIKPDHLLFDSDPAYSDPEGEARLVRSLLVAGRTWTAVVKASPLFYAQMGQTRRWEILAGGLVASLLLFTLLVAILGAERRARLLADQRGAEVLATEAQFRHVVERAADAIYIHDLEGRILFCNPEACRSTGYTMEELVGKRVQDIGTEVWEPHRAEVWRGLKAGQQANDLGRLRRRDGSSFPVEVHLGLLQEDPPLLLAMVRDLTVREQIQETETRARKAESLVLMAGGIAHDFNNLFQALQGNLEIAGMLVQGNEAISQVLDRALDALHKAVTLSWKMLDFSGHGFMHMAPLDLESWLPIYLATLRLEFPPTLEWELTCDPVPSIQVDPAKLGQVLKDLLNNALEAAGPRTCQVRLRLHVDFGEDRPGPESPGLWPLERPDCPATVCLEIADGGPGVPPEKLHLICDPFYTTKEAGRGLGLPSALGILRAHRAGLHILNGEGQGLILRLHFPPAKS